MSSNDDFIHVSTGTAGLIGGPHRACTVSEDYFANSNGNRDFTEGYMVASIRQKHPKHHLTVSPAYTANLVAFAASQDDAACFLRSDEKSLIERSFMPPARRYNDETGGSFTEKPVFASYDYAFKGNQFIIYVAEGLNGPIYPTVYNYILVEDLKQDASSKIAAQAKTDQLLAAAANWTQELHGEVYVFDQGFWQKNKDLWQNIQKASWEDVILGKEKKAAIIEDVVGFFDSEDRYAEFGVPWKVYRPFLNF